MAIWYAAANTATFNDYSTFDLGGSTSDIVFSVGVSAAIGGDVVELVANIANGSWDIRLSARLTP